MLLPADAVAAAGTNRSGLLLASATVAPPDGAAPVKVTVQVLDCPETRLSGAHWTDDGEIWGAVPCSVKEAAFEMPLSDAVSVAGWLVETAPAPAANAADADPPATVTEGGAVRSGLLDARLTIVPPDGAGPLKLTVHNEFCAAPSDVGLQLRPLRLTRGVLPITETVPPLPVTAKLVPISEAPSVFATPMEALLAAAARVTCTTAATPFAIFCWFNPNSTHLYDPAPFAQEIDFPAAAAADPAVALTDTTSAGE